MVMTAQGYHEAVAHRRGRLSGMGLDWANQPSVFKSYPGLPHVGLSRQADLPEVSLWKAVRPGPGGRALDLDGLSAVLFHAAGLTRSSNHRGTEFFYRACPSAGALYPCEIYVCWPPGTKLEAGLYHFDTARHGLTLLRQGFPDAGALGLPTGTRLPGEALIFVSAIIFRSAWKYRVRAYRYLNLDCGHVLEGLALGLSAHEVAWRVANDFDDEAVNALLGLDTSREVCLAALRFEVGGQAQAAPPGPLPEGVEAFSRSALADNAPRDIALVHELCSHPKTDRTAMPTAPRSRLGADLAWRETPAQPGPAERMGLFEAMSRRRSRRAYLPGMMPRGTLGKLLSALSGPLHPSGGQEAEDCCLVGVLAGEEVQTTPGFALLDRQGLRLGLRRDGNLRPVMAGICLDQLWMREAFAHVLFLTDFTETQARLGDRGYRLSLQAAGRLGQRVYLAAEALGLGACGIGAFFDLDAREALGLPEGVGLTYAVTVGLPRAGREE